MESLNEYKRAQAVVRRTIRTAKRTCWRQYCNSIWRETKLSEVWGVIRKINGVKRSNTISVLQSSGTVAVSNEEKAELLVNVFVKVHSSENLSDAAKESRDRTLEDSAGLNETESLADGDLDLPLTLFELKRAVSCAKQSTPGKDNISYSMLAKMDDSSLGVVLKLFNQIWETGKIPSAWKQSIVVPILKPGKEASDPTNYRPIALTSLLGKTMERIITERLSYLFESKSLFTPFQSGFRKGRSTMDAVLCLESEVRKAQTNKEIIVAVFFDIEKAYDMLWKEGLLIKLLKFGV